MGAIMHRIVKRDLKHTQKGDFATVLREWRPLAEQGGADAQYALGGMYGNGQGVLKTSRNVSGASIIDLQPTS
jgi:TPR repeat protein